MTQLVQMDGSPLIEPEAWLQVIEEEYLTDYLPSGGSAVKFLSGADATLQHTSDRLREIATRHGYYVAFLDPLRPDTRGRRPDLHRMDRFFFAVTRETDWRGWAQEFVHNTLSSPAGFLWSEDQVRELGIVSLAHSLFDACRREPDLLVCRNTLGPPPFLREEIAPSIPFAQVAPGTGNSPAAWNWINDPPGVGMDAYRLAQELQERGFVLEPFQRLRKGLQELYPKARWEEADDNSG